MPGASKRPAIGGGAAVHRNCSKRPAIGGGAAAPNVAVVWPAASMGGRRATSSAGSGGFSGAGGSNMLRRRRRRRSLTMVLFMSLCFIGFFTALYVFGFGKLYRSRTAAVSA